MMKLQSRNHGLDLLRVLACYMVLQVHAGEFYYIADGGLVAAGGEPVWACWLNSLCRTAVPLFVMLSGFFLLPVRERTRDFFARRFVRVVVPFLVWCVLYAIYQFLTGRTDAAGALLGVCRIPVNFGVEIGHLWFVYMLLGLYLFAPVVSPWIETASRRAHGISGAGRCWSSRGISRRHGFSTHGWRRSSSSRTSNFRGASGRSTWLRCRSGCSCC